MALHLEHKDIVTKLWYRELWDNWNLAAADELFTDDYQLHVSGVPVVLDREGAKQAVAMYGAAFPDLKHTVDEMIAEGDSVAARWTVRGTHRGEFQGIPGTGRTIVVAGTTFHRLRGSRVCETWLTMNTMDLVQQLGAESAP